MTNGLSGPRKQFLDVLRVLATCAVVLMHVLTGATDVTDASIVPEYRSLLLSVMDLVTWCVPIFLLISGYLFLNPERTLTYPVMIKKILQEDCVGDPPIRRSVCSFRAGSGGADLPDQDDPGGTEDDSDGTYLVPYVVSVSDLVFISDHAASEKSAACAAGVGCCSNDGSDLLGKQCDTISK